MDPEPCLRYLGDLAKDTGVRFVCHNVPYDLGWLWGRLGFKPVNVPYDTQAAVALLDEFRQGHGGYNLNAVGRDYCGLLKDESLLREAAAHLGLDPKNDIWKIPPKYVGPYAEIDGSNCLQVWNTVEPLLRAQGLWDIFDLECRFTMVITAMRMNGIRVDVDRAEQFSKSLAARELEASKEIKTLLGFEVPIWEGAVIQKAYDALGVDYPHTAKGAPSFTAPWLKTRTDRFSKLLLAQRRWEKVRCTFIDGFFLELAHNGRIYPQINPLPTDDGGTVSGRVSCAYPNVQQLSAKDEELAPEVRGCLLPDEGAEWAANDYSQQEPRLAVHFALLAGVEGARSVAEQYRTNPKTDFHQMVADIAIIKRPQAKILNLALIYGKGEAATCHELGFETEIIQSRNGPREVAGPEGKAFLAAYHRAVPFVNGLKEACKRAVKHKGYIRTLLGRHCRFGEGKSRDHTAVNRLCQGSAADQTKKAMVDMYEQLNEVPLAAVHDEVDNNKWSDRQIDLVRECMVEATPLEVPVVVDTAVGKDWGQAM